MSDFVHLDDIFVIFAGFIHAKLWRGNGNAPRRRVFNPGGFGIGLTQPESGKSAIRFADEPPGADHFWTRTGELHE